jgi:hypothetical protein
VKEFRLAIPSEGDQAWDGTYLGGDRDHVVAYNAKEATTDLEEPWDTIDREQLALFGVAEPLVPVFQP